MSSRERYRAARALTPPLRGDRIQGMTVCHDTLEKRAAVGSASSSFARPASLATADYCCLQGVVVSGDMSY